MECKPPSEIIGFYFTSYPQYASVYAGYTNGNANRPATIHDTPPAEPYHKVLVLCYVLLLNAYPVTALDEEERRLNGKGNYQNYQSHYAAVNLKKDTKMDYKPAVSLTEAEFDELIVFNEAFILPQFVVHFKPPNKK